MTKIKTVFCTECNNKISINKLIVSNKLREGCNFYGHVISIKKYREVKND